MEEGHDELWKRAAALMASDYDYLWIGPGVRSRLIQDIRRELHRVHDDVVTSATNAAVLGMRVGWKEK
jgi:hypothetical protein